jgi:hypothetical protein
MDIEEKTPLRIVFILNEKARVVGVEFVFDVILRHIFPNKYCVSL